MAHMDPLEQAHSATRGPGVVLPMATNKKWFQPSTLRKWLVDGGFQDNKIKMESVDVWVVMKDLWHWVTITWSFLGPRADGWKLEDEEKWDQVIETMVEGMESSGNCVKGEDGSTKMRFRTNIALAVK